MPQRSNDSDQTPRERQEEIEAALVDDDTAHDAELLNEDVSLEEMAEQGMESPAETSDGELIHTQDSDGSTSDPYRAQQQGLVYDPPHDPPVIPSDDPEGVDIAAGFASSVEESGVEARNLPDHVEDNDLDIEQDLHTSLKINSETTTLSDIQLRVEEGIVFVDGTVPTEADISHVDHVLRSHDAVRDVRSGLIVAD